MLREGYSLRSALLASTSLLASIIAPSSQAAAQTVLPTHGSVASGAASFSQSGGALTINQSSPRAIINWNSFSIGNGNSVSFVQPDASSAVLNRVTGSTTSSIAGKLGGNGQVYLVNPNGIAITPTGAVNVGGGFVATTLGITDKNFNQGKLSFTGDGASAPVSNAGSITAAPGGFVGLLGGSVANSGVISVPLGRIALGSGEQATLDPTGDGFLQVALPTDAKTADGQALIDVSGKVEASGGTVAIKAATAANAVRNAINLTGLASARSARASGGSIILDGGSGGNVAIRGAVSASGRKAGGSVYASGRNLSLANAKIAARGQLGKGGSAALTAVNVVKIKMTDVDVSGGAGGGEIAIGGDARGIGPLGRAAKTTIGAGSTLRANALARGDGGAIAVWSDGATTVAGRISARGGAISGDGGKVETSGETAHFGGVHVDTSAPHGLTGSWLIDPTDFTIAASGGDITGAALSAELSSTNVTILSSSGAGGTSGQINVDDPVSWSSANKLTLDAYGSILVNSTITVQGSGSVAFIYGDTTQTGVGTATGGTLQFALSDTGSTAALTFAGAGGAVSLNGVNYTLLRTEGDLGQLTATPSGDFALAGNVSLAQTYTTSVIPDFYGHLQGLGHTIANLTLASGGAAANVGFIGILDAAGSGSPANAPAGSVGAVSNLFLSNVSVNGGAATGVGALAGENFGLVFNSGSSGAVSGAGSHIGGLVGTNYGYLDNDFSSAAVTGSSTTGGDVGGLVGFNAGGVIGGLASGAVQGDDSVGGLVGLNSGYVNAGSSGFVVGNAAVGGVVGENDAAEGDFVFQGVDYGANGAVAGAYGYGGVFGTTTAGGVVGLNTGVVSFSVFNGPVSGETSIGGVVGENDGTLSNSYAIGAVSGTTHVGGLVGFNGGAIDSSFATGAVRGTTDVGGLVGLEGASGATTSVGNSYSTGAVSGAAGIGGLIGAVAAGGADTIATAYWDTLTSGQAVSAGGVGHTTTDLQGGATLALGANFAGGAAGGETGVYPYLTHFFPNGVQAISGFAYKDAAGTVPLASGAAGAVTVYADSTVRDSRQFLNLLLLENTGTTGTNGYYYIFGKGGSLPAGGNVVVYTTTNATTGETDAATYLATAGVNNTSAVNIFGSTLSETTAAAAYSQLATAVSEAISGDGTAPNVIAGVSSIKIASTAADFRIDQAISTTADLTVTGTSTTIAANVRATGGVNIDTPVTLAAPSLVDSGSATTSFGGAIDGVGAANAGLTVNGPVVLNGDVTTNNGVITFKGPVTVNANLTINSGTAATTFGSTIDSGTKAIPANYNLTAAAGVFSFGAAIGGQYALGAISLTSAAGMTPPSITSTSIVARTTAANADITLAPGTVLTASGTGAAVTLAASGAFLNDAGAGAIALTGAASTTPPNWLIYSADPTSDVFGGLDSHNQAIWNTTYGGAAPTGGDHYLFAFQPTVTFTSTDANKTYGQDTTSTVAAAFTVSGLQTGVSGAYLGDTAAVAYSGAPGVTSTGSLSTASVAASPSLITVAQGSLAAAGGYALAFNSIGHLTVSPEPITITATANTKVFDGTTSAAALPTVTSGVLYDPATLSESYATTNPGTGLELIPAVAFANPAAVSNYSLALAPTSLVPSFDGIISTPLIPPTDNPSVFSTPKSLLEVPLPYEACGADLQLPDPSNFADPIEAVKAISSATQQVVERCQDASQAEIANILDRYADALEIAIRRLPPALRNSPALRRLPALIHAAAARARVAPTKMAAIRVLKSAVAEVRREITLVRADDPDSARKREAVGAAVSGVLNSAALTLARAEGL